MSQRKLNPIQPSEPSRSRENVSVALCTYNGQQFLGEQLESIASQTQLPLELVVSDDRSEDDTLEILEAFAESAPFPVRISVNASRLGSTLNFAESIRRCTGEVIVLSDQDDVWFPHKLERLTDALDSQTEAGFVISDAVMVDSDLAEMGYSLWEALRFEQSEQEQFSQNSCFDILLRVYRATGATMAFRSSYRELLLPIPEAWVHDAWIALLIASVAKATLVTEPLVYYRQHGSQQIGERKRGLFGQFLVARAMGKDDFSATADSFELAVERLHNAVPSWPVPPESIIKLEEKVAHWRARVQMREGWFRWGLVWREWRRGRYAKYSLGWKAMLQDLFI